MSERPIDAGLRGITGTRRCASSLLVGLCALIACSASPAMPSGQQPTALGGVSLQRSQWETISQPRDFPLTNGASEHLAFDFPVDGSMNYLYNVNPPKVISGTLSVSMQVVTRGPVVFNYMTAPDNTCQSPAKVRLLIWANGNSEGEFDRWWSNPASYTLASGAGTLTVALTPDQWSSVYGKFGNAGAAAQAGFNGALRDVSRLGLTFGGGCFFGHGINVRGGSATFMLLDYRIQ